MDDQDDSAPSNYLISSVETPGCVYAIENIGGRLVIAVNTSVGSIVLPRNFMTDAVLGDVI